MGGEHVGGGGLAGPACSNPQCVTGRDGGWGLEALTVTCLGRSAERSLGRMTDAYLDRGRLPVPIGPVRRMGRLAAGASLLAVLWVAGASTATAQVQIRQVHREPPTTLEALHALPGPVPTAPCDLPAPHTFPVARTRVPLPDSTTLPIPADWRVRPRHPDEIGFVDRRFETADEARIGLERQRNGAVGRGYLVYRSGAAPQGAVCSLRRDPAGAIWSLYPPDPDDADEERRFLAFGDVVTPDGRWYSLRVSARDVATRDRAAGAISALLLEPVAN